MGRSGFARQLLQAWRENYNSQTLMSAGASCLYTALFALYPSYGSLWHGSFGVFYLLLMAIRSMILVTEHRNRAQSEEEQVRYRRRTFLVSSVSLLSLDLALMLPIAMMVVLNKPVSMGLIPAITMATYTTWKITLASLHIGRQRRRVGGNMLVAELRTINSSMPWWPS